MVLRPVRGGGLEVTAIEVRQRIDGVASADGSPLSFSAPIVYAAVTGVAERIKDLEVADAAGAVPLEVADDKVVSGGFPYFRHWRAKRAVTFPVTVRYSALVQPPDSPNGPAFGIRPAGGGVSGSGGGFLLLPENAGTTHSRVSWNLDDMPAGSVGVTTFGEGSFELPGAADALMQGWILAGPAHRYKASGASRFDAFWLGEPPFDAQSEMAWAASAYAYLARSFGYLDPAPQFRVFMRALDTPPYGGGTALGNSFMLSMNKEKMKGTPADLRETFFHEMSHQWVGSIEGDYTVIAWFVEGLNVYYTTVLPLRGGLIPVDEYGERVNGQARQYYESPARNWSATKIGEVGFGDEAIRHTPYMRGALYFADLDWQIRRHSHGKRDLDAFLHPMFVSRLSGKRFDVPAWEEMLRRELGEGAVADFRASMLEGTRTVVPASEAFGPCFRREKVEMKAGSALMEGYQWQRVQGVPDKRCFTW